MTLSRPQLALATAATALVIWSAFFANAGALGFIGPDEPRYAAVARAMSETGDWVTPRLNGQPWFEKPILYYWGAAAAFRLAGASEQAARLPSALAALAATLAMLVACWRADGQRAAFALALIMPTTGLLMGFAHAASTDMVFAGALTLALAAAARLLNGAGNPEGRDDGAGSLALDNGADGDSRPVPGTAASSAKRPHVPVLWRLAWGVALGCAVLAKGPAAVALAGGSVVLWALLTRRWADACRLAHPVAVAAAAVVALPWYIVCAARNPEFLRVFLVEHNVQRFLTPVFEHRQPFWYFGVVLVIGLVPWTALLVPVAVDARAWMLGRQRARHDALLALCWAVVPVVFFSLSQSKLPGYILPTFPPLAWLMARVAARDADRRAPLLCRVLIVIGATIAALTVAAYGAGRYLSEDARQVLATVHAPAAAWVVVGATGAAVAVLALRRQAWAALTSTAALTTSLILLVGSANVPSMDASLTPRAAGRAAAAVAGTDPIATYRLDRGWRYGLDYYTRRVTTPWDGRAGVVVATPDGERALRALGYTVRTEARVSDAAVVLRVRPGGNAPSGPTPP